jgi:uncharacterized membrane protein HdeD (DUF308 family)
MFMDTDQQENHIQTEPVTERKKSYWFLIFLILGFVGLVWGFILVTSWFLGLAIFLIVIGSILGALGIFFAIREFKKRRSSH